MGGWKPTWLDACLRCERSFDVCCYRVRGLCHSCHRVSGLDGTAEEFDRVFSARRQGIETWQAIALRIGKQVGATAAAERLGVGRLRFVAWARGRRAVDDDKREAVLAVWREVSGWEDQE